MPLRSIGERAATELATRTGVDRDRILAATKDMPEYIKVLTPAECAIEVVRRAWNARA